MRAAALPQSKARPKPQATTPSKAEASPLTPDLIDEDSPTPLYHQVYLALRERIRSGVYPTGSLLPGEQELVRVMGVSRITVKRALNELAAGGFVARHRGRGTSVTFNAAAPVVKGSFENLFESLKLMGLGTEVELLDVAEVDADDALADLMGLEPGAPLQRAVRLRKIEGAPFSYLVTHVPADIARRFPTAELAKTPLLELLERAGFVAVEAEQWISACAADPETAKALGLASGAPVLEIKRIMRDQEGRVVEALQGHYRPERFQHHMKLTRRRRRGRDEWR
ncbi:MAG: GntR family transcriptional regulator [Hyphomonadaceae bacterium]|nr:GntR family transcriptional regulator [Hyphomonadaceae bacterium]